MIPAWLTFQPDDNPLFDESAEERAHYDALDTLAALPSSPPAQDET